ncbi:hypothetical protein Vi05172_g12619 [Venturia inaequalis]|nr:hypothetical protein Vi05172_g12619 [Venturia inaequalis]
MSQKLRSYDGVARAFATRVAQLEQWKALRGSAVTVSIEDRKKLWHLTQTAVCMPHLHFLLTLARDTGADTGASTIAKFMWPNRRSGSSGGQLTTQRREGESSGFNDSLSGDCRRLQEEHHGFIWTRGRN